MNFKRGYADVMSKLFPVFAILMVVRISLEKHYVVDKVVQPEMMFGFTDDLKAATVERPKPITRDLLVFSYMRSGSSVTGGLLRDSPRTFYMYEPLIPLAPYHYFTDELYCEMTDTTCRSTNARVRLKQATLTLINLYSCNMKAVRTTVLNKLAEENKSGKPWEDFGKCLKETKMDEDHQINNVTVPYCLEKLEHACKEADVRVTKVLRLGFETIEHLLELMPNLNVLFLARDPRAIMNSRIKTTWFPVSVEEPKTIVDNILSLCLKMENDFRAFKAAKSKFTSRLKYSTLQTLASSNAEMLGLFNFINKTVTKEDLRNINSCSHKNSQTNITEKWRSELNIEFRKLEEKHCLNVMQNNTMSTSVSKK